MALFIASSNSAWAVAESELPVNYPERVMAHIKTSPDLKGIGAARHAIEAPLLELRLSHPNEIGALSPWEMDFRQLNSGRLSAALRLRATPTLSLLNLRLNDSVHQRGASPDGWMTFGIGRRHAIQHWQGKDLDADALIAFGDADGFDGVSAPCFSGNVLSVSSKRLAAFAEACGYALPGERPSARALRSEAGRAGLGRLERRIEALLRPGDVPWTTAVEEHLMIDLLFVLTDSKLHRDKSWAHTRRVALDKAVEAMQANLEEPVSIETICRLSEASWRTLNRAFLERFGQSPKTYYIRLRLNAVRQALLSGEARTVSEAAHPYGFWHLGQFARDYRRFFGELPSQTLQQGR